MRPPAAVDLDVAFRAALAVYYFPGMWEWDREIVRPLAREALAGSVRAQADAAGVAGDEAEPIVADGERLLERYFEWAPAVDDFVPVRVETDFEVPIPDPADPSRDLVTPAGEPIHYRGRIDLLAVDGDDNYWIVDHRARWTDTELLLLDQRSASFCWAWELFFLGMRIAGVIFNEVRTDGPPTDEPVQSVRPQAVHDVQATQAVHDVQATQAVHDVQATQAVHDVQATQAAGVARHRRMYVEAARAPSGVVTQHQSHHFRRTRVPKSAAELETLRRQMAYEALDMVAPDVRLYPNPSTANCTPCGFRAPCLAMNAGGAGGADAEAILASAAYRDAAADDVVEGRLGGVSWAMGRGAAPPKFGRNQKEGS